MGCKVPQGVGVLLFEENRTVLAITVLLEENVPVSCCIPPGDSACFVRIRVPFFLVGCVLDPPK